MESKQKRYQLEQKGKKYILSIQTFQDKLRFVCIEFSSDKQIIYIGQFNILELTKISSVFSSVTEISEALDLFDEMIVKQKINIELKENYLNLNILIKNQNKPDEKFTIKLILFNRANSGVNTQNDTKSTNVVINQNDSTSDYNKIDENLVYSPNTENKQEPKTPTINEKNVESPVINNQIQEEQIINSPSNNIIVASNYQIQSSNINTNTDINNNFSEQYIQSQNISNNDNINQNYEPTTNDINIISQEQYINSSEQVNNNNHGEDLNLYSPKINSDEKKNIHIDGNESSSVDNYIQQFLQSSGNVATEETSPLNLVSSNEQYIQQSQENIELNQQLIQDNQDYHTNLISQENQTSNIDFSPQTQNNIQINKTTETDNSSKEMQYIQQQNQISTTNISSQGQYIQQQDEITPTINSIENYIPQTTNTNITTQNEYYQSIQQPTTINSNTITTTTNQTQYIQIPTTKITTQKQYVIQNQPLETQALNYNITENQIKKVKKIKNEKIILPLLPQQQEQPKIEENNYESSAQIYSEPIQQPIMPQPQIIVQDNPELETLRNENARLKEEINLLKNQMQIYINENETLKTKTIVKSEIQNNSQEILLLKQEIERLRIELARFNEYKIQKEEEIDILNIQIQNLLKRIKELERINEDLRAYIAKISQMKSGENNTEQIDALCIQDTRLEIIRGDIIENAKELELLTRRICNNKYKKISLNLIYKAIIDSDRANVFHNKCDSAKMTLVLVKSGNDKRFGGFTSYNWEGNSIEKKDENAFVFSLDNLKIYNIISGEGAIGCYPNFGPVFLGCQIRIYDQFFRNGGTTFEKGVNYETKEDFELTGGLRKFDIKDIEVYSVELMSK